MSSQKNEFLGILETIDFQSIKDHPNILIAASFWEPERYQAAKTCYRFMRAIDDLIDDYKAANKKIAPEERGKFMEEVESWLKMIMGKDKTDFSRKELVRTIEKFKIPVWPLETFARSMIYDINNDGFATIDSFLDYSQGASVAPASIFVHLNGLGKVNGRYIEPPFDVREAATPCAIFSYLVHIIRDFQKDQLNNLNYFADNLLARYRLNRFDLKEIAWGHSVPASFRKLIGEYYALADIYRLQTYDIIKKISPLLQPRYRLSLEIIFDLYLMVFERIDIEKGKFTTEEMNPGPDETRERVFNTIMRFSEY